MAPPASLRATLRALVPGPGRGPLRRLRLALLPAAMPRLVRRHHLGELLRALDAQAPAAPGPAPGPRHGPRSGPAPARGLLESLALGRTTCLYRSLAAFASRRAAGEPVQFLIGVRVEAGEVLAHAWLERAGEPLDEPEPPRSRFAVAFTYPGARGAGTAREDPMHGRRTSQDAILTELHDGTGVLLDLRGKFYFTLNRTGVAIWKQLSAGAPADAAALADRIAEEFDAPSAEVVRRDVEAMLATLEQEGLLVGPA